MLITLLNRLAPIYFHTQVSNVAMNISLKYFLYTEYSIVSYDDIYADALSNRSLILNSCNYMLQYSNDWLYYCNYTINRGQCASRPLTVRCETGICICHSLYNGQLFRMWRLW